MTIFITQARYSKDGVAGLLAQPDDRLKALNDLAASAGSRLIDVYFTLGEFDVVIISEAPDEKTMLATLLPVAATGAISDLRTTVAYRPADFAAAAQHARDIAYKPPGKG